MTSTTIGDVTFDLTANPTTLVSGYTKAQRDTLTDDMLIKVRNLATKTNLPAKLTKGLQVTTYNPDDLKNKNNFFNFVSSWEGNVLSIESHLKTFYMTSPFVLYKKIITEPSEEEKEFYNVDLQEFLSQSRANGGDNNSYILVTPGDPTAVPPIQEETTVVERPRAPPPLIAIQAGGDIIREWHTMELQDVIESIQLQLNYVDDATHRQNIVWSFEYFINSLDSDFKAYVLSKISSMDTDIGRSGPIVYYLVAKRLLFTSENLAQKVINGFIALRLTHFEGENVSDAIFTIRNVLKFLRFNETNSFAPPTTITMIYDVFRGTSVGSFRNHVQQAQDILLHSIKDPELIFDHLQIKYEELLLADRWVPMKKKPSAFVMGDPQTKTYVESEKQKQAPKPSETAKTGNDNTPKETVKDSNGKDRYKYDAQGNKIDYTPPKNGQPHQRKKGDKTEHWCSKCVRWGNHPDNKHEEFFNNLKKNRKTNRSSSNNANASQVRGSVTFAQATRGNLRLAVDPELTDGIDL